MKMELQRVLEAYRAMEPVKDVIHMIKTQFAADRRWTSLEFQTQVLQVVVNDPVCDDFAPLRKYTYRFLKSFVNEIEVVHADVDDGLVEALMEFVLNSKLVDDALNSEAMHHVSYTVPTADSSVVVTCRVASVFNEVGLKLWEAGWLLAEYIIAHESEFRGRKVLELGAGVGFTGMALACVCRSSRVVLTDYAPNVMQNLRYNVEVNTSKFVCPVEVQTLDWDTWQPTDHEDERFDVLLAGDCAYDVAAFPPLMHVLQLFLGNDQGSTNRHPQRVAIFAATIRNQKTFQELLDQLAAHRIDYVDITKSSLEKMGKQLFPYPNRDQIRICRLTRTLEEKTTQ
ncbi:hypothetical protein JG687_00007771 [Phytophthora cactorum]|uniref:FAM86 N-terminal domain-containing protein n=1 Tax=Phytophthora cactorum TaxID=29920 RepID=A0A8T1UGI8_9STRA|nr:hypothetical protein PC120_g15044 [Phytophthora cactorum]KAG3054589.1 hypothetical protein PC121_g16222 [Phytophthora cactorum]KAG3175920.1 hypothetical protein PC128_g17519 [Phytophthora cactorum]KAG4049543.1 hypothetical protein PC123_g15180 [Phytophthora cactorum]KAG6961269.1 hypothetical protein JG687_00007771 [Phytophthora cactorum]